MAEELALTRLQLDILRLLWERGEATVVEVQEALPGQRLALSSVATLLSRMERRGIVEHRTAGRQFVYRAAVPRQRVQQSLVGELAQLGERLFAGDMASLVSTLLDEAEVDSDELARIRAMVEAEEARRRSKEES
jgi:predicted transcriptional regulator